MAYARMPEGRTSIRDILYQHGPPSSASGRITGVLCDLVRLLRLEEIHYGVQAYTLSLMTEDACKEKRHTSVDLTSPRGFHRIHHVFDQISFDWVNAPDSYIVGKQFKILELLKELADNGKINPAGGAVYLPFNLAYYAIVAGNEAELSMYYKIDYIDEEVAAQENHLYRGTMGLGNEALEFLKITDIRKERVTVDKISEGGDIQGVLMKTVKAHHDELCENLPNADQICMIRLQVYPKETIQKILPVKKEEKVQNDGVGDERKQLHIQNNMHYNIF